jgi:peptidoglycan hydrolase-like protein with peptidoglycan-binding domain
VPKAPSRTLDRERLDDGGRAGSLLSAIRRRPVDSLAAALAVACTGMIIVNALALQQGRHPAPFFAPAAPRAAQAQVEAPQRDELVAQIQTALSERGYYDGPRDGLYGARTAAAIAAFEQAQAGPQTGKPSERLLGAILTAAPKAAAVPAPAPAAASRPSPAPARSAATSAPATTGSTEIAGPRLMAVQRALAKLGYGPVTIDGKMGAETRNAISSFERDRRMQPTGEPSPLVLRELRAMTGAPVE